MVKNLSQSKRMYVGVNVGGVGGVVIVEFEVKLVEVGMVYDTRGIRKMTF